MSKSNIQRVEKSNIQRVDSQHQIKSRETQLIPLQLIPLQSGTRQCCQVSPYLCNIVLEVLAIAEQGDIQLGMEEVILSSF